MIQYVLYISTLSNKSGLHTQIAKYPTADAVNNSQQAGIYPTPPCSAEDNGEHRTTSPAETTSSEEQTAKLSYSDKPSVLTKYSGFLQSIVNLRAVASRGIVPRKLPPAHREVVLSTVKAAIETLAPWLCWKTPGLGCPTPKVVHHTMDVMVKLTTVEDLRSEVCEHLKKFVHAVVVALVDYREFNRVSMAVQNKWSG